MKHNWDFLISESVGKTPYPMYFCRKCGKFASNFPGQEFSFNVSCKVGVSKLANGISKDVTE